MLTVMLFITATSFAAFELIMQYGGSLEQGRTTVVNLIVLSGILYMFSCRSWDKSLFTTGVKGNRPMLFGAVGMVLLQLIFTYNIWFEKFFQTADLSWKQWGIAFGGAFITTAAVEINKAVIRYRLKKTEAEEI